MRKLSAAAELKGGVVMRRGLVLCMCVALISVSAAQAQRYLYTGLGPRIALGVVDDLGPAFNAGFHVDVGIDIGRAGEIHYYPMIDFWIAQEDYTWGDFTLAEIDLNIFDFRYYFPVPGALVVKPYGGFAPAIVIAIRSYDYEPLDDRDDSDADGEFGMNIYGGADFVISPSFILFGEIRGKFGDADLAKMTFGMTFPISGAR